METLRSFFRRATGSFSKDRLDSDLNAELRSHLELLTQENIAKGMSADEARREAHLTLGGDAQIKDAYRAQAGLPWLDILLHDLRYGFRYLRKNPGFTTVAVLTLALGIGANTAIFSVVYAVLLRPLPYAQPQQLVSIRGGQSWPDLDDFRRQSHTLSSVGAYWPSQFDLVGDREPELAFGAMVSLDLFDTLGVPPYLGRTFNSTDDVTGGRRVVVLGYTFWRDRYASDPNAIGKTIRLSDNNYEIIGVMPKSFWLPSGEGQFYVPFRIGYPEAASERGVHAQYAIARLRPDVTVAQAQSDIDSIAAGLAKLYPGENRDRRYPVVALQERVVGSVRTTVLVLFGAVALVLLIACVNFANLLLAKASARKEETQIRAALGASTGRLIHQFLTESVMLSLIGGAIGVALAYFGLQALMLLSPGNLPRIESVSIDRMVLVFALGLSLVTGIVFGLLPIVAIIRRGAPMAPRSGHTVAGQSPVANRMRQALIVLEFTLSIVLLCGAGLLLRSMSRLQSVDPGFDPQNVTTARIWLQSRKYSKLEAQGQFYAQLDERLKQIPGAQNAALVSELPLGGNRLPHNLIFNGRPPVPEGSEPDVLTNLISPDYFTTMHIPLRRGRAFADSDRAGAPLVAIINEEMVRQFYANEDPLGQQVRYARADGPPQWITIVGVVGNVKDYGPDREDEPMLYTPMQQKTAFWRTWSGMVVRGDNPVRMIEGIKQAVWSLDPAIPITKTMPMNALLAESLSQRRFTALLLVLFAATALALAVVGIYGVIAYSVVQRTREFGVRIALGAQRANVVWIVLRQAVVLGAIGTGLGILGSFFASRAMASLVFGITPRDPATFISVPLLLLAVALVAAFVPAWRATRIDPTTALRAE
jgi:putative ABC transport system permease protein